MDVGRVNYVLERAILGFQTEEIEALYEYYAVPTPAEMHRRSGMALPKSPQPKKVKSPKNEPPPVTVEFLEVILNNRLISWDRKYGNAYSLGHLLGALQKAAKATSRIRHKSDVASLEKYRAAVKREFTPGFEPIQKFEKALDNYLKTGRRPRLVK